MKTARLLLIALMVALATSQEATSCMTFFEGEGCCGDTVRLVDGVCYPMPAAGSNYLYNSFRSQCNELELYFDSSCMASPPPETFKFDVDVCVHFNFSLPTGKYISAYVKK